MGAANAVRFRRMLERNHELGERLARPGFDLSALEGLQAWQRARFQQTYADFLARDSDAPACHFFLDELYGGLDFRRRDEDVSRVAPVMIRLLPDHALGALADAFLLQAISLELDIAMAEVKPETDFARLDVSGYAELYRRCGRREARETQIRLIRDLGHRLDRLVRSPLLLRLVSTLRGPARAAGFGALQSFLETGLQAFRRLENPTAFVEAIHEREWAAMERLFAGDEAPFATVVSG